MALNAPLRTAKFPEKHQLRSPISSKFIKKDSVSKVFQGISNILEWLPLQTLVSTIVVWCSYFPNFNNTTYFDISALNGYFWSHITGPILESKVIRAIFQKKSKKRANKAKIFENLGKNKQNLEVFWKRTGNCARLSHTINCSKRPSISWVTLLS